MRTRTDRPQGHTSASGVLAPPRAPAERRHGHSRRGGALAALLLASAAAVAGAAAPPADVRPPAPAVVTPASAAADRAPPAASPAPPAASPAPAIADPATAAAPSSGLPKPAGQAREPATAGAVAPALPGPLPAGEPDGEARLVISAREVTVFRVPLLGLSPGQRVERAERAIQGILERSPGGAVSVLPMESGSAVLLEGQFVFLLVEGDQDRAAGETLEEATRRTVSRLELVARETAEGRDRARLLGSVIRSAIATALLAVLLGLLRWAGRRTEPHLAGISARVASALRVGGTPVVGAERLESAARWILVVVGWAAGILAAYRWAGYVLVQFPATRPWGEQATEWLVGALSRVLGGALRSIPDLLVAVLIFLLARWALALAGPLFDRVESGRLELRWLDRDSARPTRRIMALAVWLFALVMAYPYLPGSSSEAFKGMSVLVGLMVTIGGSSVFGQAASGLILMYSRTLRVGEYVEIAGQEGTITEMGHFVTKLRTGMGEELSLPNATVLASVTRNYSRAVRGPGYVVDTVVTIGYDTPWRQVEAMLIEAARRTPGVLTEPAPRVFLTGLRDFYPEYRLVCQAVPSEPRPRAEVLHQLHANVQDVFNEYGVQIMSPHYLGDPAEAKVVPKEGWYPPPARRPEP